MRLDFTVPGVPVAQPRQRHRVVSSGGRTFATNFTPARDPVNAYKASVQLAASQAHQGAPLDGPLGVRIVFVFPRPKSLCWKKRPMPRAHVTKKPDGDNLIKSTTDALNGMLWNDDAQIADVQAVKVFAAGDEQPHTEVTVWGLEESPTTAGSLLAECQANKETA